jgi:hypothetical protein
MTVMPNDDGRFIKKTEPEIEICLADDSMDRLKAALDADARPAEVQIADAKILQGDPEVVTYPTQSNGTEGQDRENYSDDQDRKSYTVAEPVPDVPSPSKPEELAQLPPSKRGKAAKPVYKPTLLGAEVAPEFYAAKTVIFDVVMEMNTRLQSPAWYKFIYPEEARIAQVLSDLYSLGANDPDIVFVPESKHEDLVDGRMQDVTIEAHFERLSLQVENDSPQAEPSA